MKETILREGLVVKEILAPYRNGETKNNDNVSLRVFPKYFYNSYKLHYAVKIVFGVYVYVHVSI